jgi:hypothetical protein
MGVQTKPWTPESLLENHDSILKADAGKYPPQKKQRRQSVEKF